jgi:TetR/AcrR family transcriptional repressor of lmrAB and yxaGH operons
MAAEAKHREAIVTAAVNLFRQRGFTATGMNDIVAESGAPKGSVYHYFPEGKAQIGAEALAYAGRHLHANMLAMSEIEPDPAVLISLLIRGVADTLEQSGFRHGCPVAGIVLDTPPGDLRIMRAAEDAMGLWRQLIAQICARAGLAQDRAAFIASVAISTFEGALIQARAARDTAPMLAAAEALAMIVNAELHARPQTSTVPAIRAERRAVPSKGKN